MNLIRLLSLFCLCHVFAVYQAEQEFYNGKMFCRLIHLPHRGLGMIFHAHGQFPGRSDFVQNYITEWTIYDHDEWLVEGQVRPEIPMLACSAARQFPRNENLWAIRSYFMDQWRWEERAWTWGRPKK